MEDIDHKPQCQGNFYVAFQVSVLLSDGIGHRKVCGTDLSFDQRMQTSHQQPENVSAHLAGLGVSRKALFLKESFDELSPFKSH